MARATLPVLFLLALSLASAHALAPNTPVTRTPDTATSTRLSDAQVGLIVVGCIVGLCIFLCAFAWCGDTREKNQAFACSQTSASCAALCSACCLV